MHFNNTENRYRCVSCRIDALNRVSVTTRMLEHGDGVKTDVILTRLNKASLVVQVGKYWTNYTDDTSKVKFRGSIQEC